MKIKEKTLRKIIKMPQMHEIVDLSTGSTQFETNSFEDCQQIKIPKLFKDVFLNKLYAKKGYSPTPREVKSAVTKHFNNVSQGIGGVGQIPRNWKTMSEKQKIQIINAMFSDEVIDNMSFYMQQFMSIAGVPAVFCKFLQMAIDELASIMELFVDFEATDDSEKIPDLNGFINNKMKKGIEAYVNNVNDTRIDNWLYNNKAIAFKNKFAIAGDEGSILDSRYDSYVYLYWISNIINKLTEKMTIFQSPLTSNVPADNIKTDDELSVLIVETYKNFGVFLKSVGKAERRIAADTSVEDIMNTISNIHNNEIKIDSLKNNLLNSESDAENSFNKFTVDDNRSIESISSAYEILSDNEKMRKKTLILTSYKTILIYTYKLSLTYLIKALPAAAGEVDVNKFYKNFPKFYKSLKAIATQILS
jgi:hypothetical protein